MKVLIVDDSALDRLLLSVFFEEIAETDFVENGQEAIDAVVQTIGADSPYDLICLDIVMPVMDGLEALRQIRLTEKYNGLRRAKIFMITSSSSPDDMVTAIGTGDCDDYIVKPVVVDTFFKLLGKHDLLGGTFEE